MTDARCEPRPNGWYWREDVVTGHLTLCRWVNSTTTTNRLVGARFSSSDYPLSYSDDELSPVLTPAEVAALRAERDAAWNEVEREREKYKDDMHAALVEVARWSQRSGLQDAELTTLRGEVEKLKRLLEECANDLALEIDSRYPNAGQHPSEAKRRDRDMEIVNLARAALEPRP